MTTCNTLLFTQCSKVSIARKGSECSSVQVELGGEGPNATAMTHGQLGQIREAALAKRASYPGYFTYKLFPCGRFFVCRKTCVLCCLGDASLHLDFAICVVGVGPPTAFRRNGPSVPWVSLPGPTGVMTLDESSPQCTVGVLAGTHWGDDSSSVMSHQSANLCGCVV